MASRLAAAAVAAASSSSSPSSLARLIPRRGLADPAGRYCPVKVNLWEDPMSPMRWKQSHFIVTSITVWAGFVYCGFKLFGEDEKNKTKAP
ncbi:unnamed protein product [Urochloa decumbens]|uniref:Uncharacterized protein n=1 Tax=Urochloa decumbens TaxID=240449 RepID=A0ABC8YZ13_9POAL